MSFAVSHQGSALWRSEKGAHCSRRPFSARPRVRCVNVRAASEAVEASRRDVLLSAGAVLSAVALPVGAASAAEGKILTVDKLGSFQRQEQRDAFRLRAQKELGKVLTAEDAPKAVRLVLNDAGTWDEVTKTGGLDGSIVLSDELNRPENAGLKDLVPRLQQAKAAIDEESAKLGAGPISWADLLVLAGKVATVKGWREIKLKRAATAEGGNLIADAFSAAWPVPLGRLDRSEAAPAGRIPQPGASVEEVRNYMLGLGAKPSPGPFAARPPFWERPAFVIWTAAQDDPAAAEEQFAAANPAFADFKKKYDQSRSTITRTDYEVDFITYYTKLTSLGAKFDADAYLAPLAMGNLKL